MLHKPLDFLSFLLITFIMLYMNNISVQSQDNKLGIFEGHSDIGKIEHPGSVVYNQTTQEYTIEGSGTNIWGTNDEFQFLWKKLKGDFILTAQVEFVGKGVEANRKIGWMARQSLDSNSPHVSAIVHGSGLTSLQYRRTKGGILEEKRSASQGPDIIQLQRKGKTYIMSVAHWGETFVREEIADSTLGDEVYIGLFVCAHNPKVIEKAIFKNVRIEIPAGPNLVQYTDYLGSYLEIMDIATGTRKIIHQEPVW